MLLNMAKNLFKADRHKAFYLNKKIAATFRLQRPFFSGSGVLFYFCTGATSGSGVLGLNWVPSRMTCKARLVLGANNTGAAKFMVMVCSGDTVTTEIMKQSSCSPMPSFWRWRTGRLFHYLG